MEQRTRSEVVVETLLAIRDELTTIRTLVERLAEERPGYPEQGVRLSTDSNGRIKPEVTTRGPDLAQCEAQATATMDRLLAKYPPPPRTSRASRRPESDDNGLEAP
jgi:hypothetical protein